MKVKLDKPSPIIRKKDKDIQVLSFEMEREDRRATLLGMVHVADSEFFEERSENLRERPEAVILAEGIKTGENSSNPVANALGLFYKAISKAFKGDPTVQTEVFPPEDVSERTISADVNANEIGQTQSAFIEALSSALKTDCKIFEEIELEDQTVESLRGYFKMLLANGLKQVGAIPEWVMKIMPTSIKELIEDILIKRNIQLLEEIEYQTKHEDRDVIVPWGVAHLPDLTRRMENEGWTYIPDSKNYTTILKEPGKIEQIKTVIQVTFHITRETYKNSRARIDKSIDKLRETLKQL